jgi:phage tail protein X
VFSDIPNPPPALQELRLKLREVLANIGYCMAAGMGTDEQVLRHDLSVKFPDEATDARLAALAAALESIADEAEVSAVLAVSEHVLLPDPPVSS